MSGSGRSRPVKSNDDLTLAARSNLMGYGTLDDHYALNPVPRFARFGEPKFKELAKFDGPFWVIFSVIFFPALVVSSPSFKKI